MGSNPPGALLRRAPGERSEDFCAVQRRKSNGIFKKPPLLWSGGPFRAFFRGRQEGARSRSQLGRALALTLETMPMAAYRVMMDDPP